MLTAVSTMHNAGIVHRSIGRNSFLLSSIRQDKREETSPYAVVISQLRLILSDWGFSALAEDASQEKESGVRSRMLDITRVDLDENQVAVNDRINTAATEFASMPLVLCKFIIAQRRHLVKQ
jgi:serine/threonine protein kinase